MTGKILYTSIFLSLCSILWGQGVIMPELAPVENTDSIEFIPSREIQLNNFIIPGKFLFSEKFKLQELPEFEFYDGLMNLKQDYNYYIFNPEGRSNVSLPFAAFPFTHSATIFNQAAYKISDRLTFGGSSYGAKSIFSAPLPNQGLNNFDVRGASMFLQYKVSKNIKIETHINVNNRQF